MTSTSELRALLEKLAASEHADACVVLFDGSLEHTPILVESTKPESLSLATIETSCLFNLLVPRAADTVIHNTKAMDRTKEDPLVVDGPNVTFYAERPLVLRGCIVGILCLFSDEAKETWAPSQVFDATCEDMQLAYQKIHDETPEVQGRMASYASTAGSWTA
eukprot:gb/GFBE01006177.1/.p1 GENE.gb/GFBE01006177.1/~~gb/GFBE01006177.1/.p1  ORF type:complete len:163 (+),score=32.78 gb/GFBE01006177.1/:1-489(+)